MKTLLLFALVLLSTTLSNAQNLLVYYTFQSCTANDESGNANHGTLVGGATINCNGNRALKAGKTDTDYMIIPPNVLDGLNDFSIHVKVRFSHFHVEGTKPLNTVISASNPGCINCFGIAYDKSSLAWRVYLNGSVYTFPDSNVDEHRARNCMSLFRENGNITLTRNNVLLGTAFNNTPLGITNFIIGQQEHCLGGCFEKNQSLEGGIDNFKVYDGIKDISCGENVFAEKREEEEAPLRAGDGIIIYPNPVSSLATITFSLEEDSQVTIELFDVAGRKSGILLDANLDAGNHTVQFDRGELAPGIYLVQLKVNNEVVTKKLVIE